jgi:group I intron endonuclease
MSSLARFSNTPKFSSSIDHGLAPPTPSVHEISADEAVRPSKRGLFPCLAELVAKVALWGRDAFVAEVLAKKRDDDIPDFSRKYKEGDNDGVIYAIFFLVSGKTYVGQTTNYDARVGKHFSGRGGARSLANDINEHGRESFVPVILLADIQQKEELGWTEIAVIKALDCLVPERGYNLHAGGTGGGAASKETKAAISDWHKAKTLSKEHRENIGAFRKGKKHSKETKAAISATKKGNTIFSEEHRLKISASMKKSVIITLETSLEIVCASFKDAAKKMGVSRQMIGKLVNKKRNNSTSKGGDYAGQLFEARYRD